MSIHFELAYLEQHVEKFCNSCLVVPVFRNGCWRCSIFSKLETFLSAWIFDGSLNLDNL